MKVLSFQNERLHQCPGTMNAKRSNLRTLVIEKGRILKASREKKAGHIEKITNQNDTKLEDIRIIPSNAERMLFSIFKSMPCLSIKCGNSIKTFSNLQGLIYLFFLRKQLDDIFHQMMEKKIKKNRSHGVHEMGSNTRKKQKTSPVMMKGNPRKSCVAGLGCNHWSWRTPETIGMDNLPYTFDRMRGGFQY